MKAALTVGALVGAAAFSAVASAATGPTTPNQAIKVIETLLAREATPCSETWTHISAQGLTMSGPPLRVTATVKTKKGSGPAIWLLSGSSVKPQNKLATAISAGCSL